jgi:hypothetical protein
MIKLFFACCLLYILACTSPSEKKLVGIKNGDVSIAYTMSGSGDTSIVFVHGWGISKEYWKQQQDA